MNYNKIDRKIKINVRKKNDSEKGRGGKKNDFTKKYTPLVHLLVILELTTSPPNRFMIPFYNY